MDAAHFLEAARQLELLDQATDNGGPNDRSR
jgi:hypothetical protein